MILNIFSTALFKFYIISIILFLKNNLTNICCKKNKIGMNLWMVYISIWRVLEKVQHEKMVRRWMYFTLLTEIIRDLWLRYTILGILKAFSWWWLQWRNNYPGRWNYCSKLKKGKLKTKNLSKITTYIRWTRAFSAIRSRQNQSSASLKLGNYVFTKTWKLPISIYLKMNTTKLWRLHARVREFLWRNIYIWK